MEFKQLSENEIKFTESESGHVKRSGILIKNTASDEWEKPNGDVVDLTSETVTWLTQVELDAITAEEAVNDFRVSRQALITAATVTVTAGHVFDADEQSILRMLGRITRERLSLDTKTIGWSLNTDPTGVFTNVTLGDLKEAYDLAVDYMDSVWSIPE